MTVAEFFNQSVGWENKPYNLYVYSSKDDENASGVIYNITGSMVVNQFGEAHVIDSVEGDLYVCEHNVQWDKIACVFRKLSNTRVSIRDTWY